MMEQVLNYFYKHHWAPSFIDKWLGLPIGSSRIAIVEDWKQERVFSSRMMRRG